MSGQETLAIQTSTTGKLIFHSDRKNCDLLVQLDYQKKANTPFLLPEFDHTINCFPIKFISLLPIKISTAYLIDSGINKILSRLQVFDLAMHSAAFNLQVNPTYLVVSSSFCY